MRGQGRVTQKPEQSMQHGLLDDGVVRRSFEAELTRLGDGMQQ